MIVVYFCFINTDTHTCTCNSIHKSKAAQWAAIIIGQLFAFTVTSAISFQSASKLLIFASSFGCFALAFSLLLLYASSFTSLISYTSFIVSLAPEKILRQAHRRCPKIELLRSGIHRKQTVITKNKKLQNNIYSLETAIKET